jgi:hypothetical protein
MLSRLLEGMRDLQHAPLLAMATHDLETNGQARLRESRWH